MKTTNEIATLEKKLAAAQKRSLEWAERRYRLPPGSSRARVTTANAEWARAAEHRDRLAEQLESARVAQATETAPAIAIVPSVSITVGSKITLGRQTYTVYHVGTCMIRMTGARGGAADLVQNQKNPTLWALCKGTRSEWYRQTATGFQAI